MEHKGAKGNAVGLDKGAYNLGSKRSQIRTEVKDEEVDSSGR